VNTNISTATEVVDEYEAAIIRHSLGLTNSEVAYRNHFAACPDTRDFRTCEALQGRGLMALGRPRPPSPYTFFYVTEAGRKALAAFDAGAST
jgi:hypothetical protein